MRRERSDSNDAEDLRGSGWEARSEKLRPCLSVAGAIRAEPPTFPRPAAEVLAALGSLPMCCFLPVRLCFEERPKHKDALGNETYPALD